MASLILFFFGGGIFLVSPLTEGSDVFGTHSRSVFLAVGVFALVTGFGYGCVFGRTRGRVVVGGEDWIARYRWYRLQPTADRVKVEAWQRLSWRTVDSAGREVLLQFVEDEHVVLEVPFGRAGQFDPRYVAPFEEWRARQDFSGE